MKNFLLFCGLLLSLFSASFAQADLTEQQRIADAEQLVNLFHHRYAPMSWKEKLWKIDRNDLANKLMEEAANAKNDIEFYEAMINYLGALQDAHLYYSIPSTAEYAYNLDFGYFGHSVLVSKIYRALGDVYPQIKRGDVLVGVNGKPVEEEMKYLLRYSSTGNELSDKKTAAYYLSNRPQETFPSTPQDGEKILLTLHSQENGQEYSIETTWKKIAGFDLANIKGNESTATSELADGSHNNALGKTLVANSSAIYIPNGSFPLWNSFVLRNEKPFVSGIFISGEKRIGFLRLHTWDNEKFSVSAKEALDFLANEIIFLQKTTDALVIDQNNNVGGLGCLAEAVAGFFTSTPKPSLLFALKPTRSWLIQYEKQLASTDDDWTRRLLGRQVTAIREALNNGNDLTQPIPMCNANGMIEPIKDQAGNKISYTHPVLLLINQDSCSAADMFPAMLQDMGAATTFGTKTHGCGGNVEEEDFLGYSDLKVHFTASLIVRPKTQLLEDGAQTNYIENVGVTPDIPYEITEKDFYDNYESYRQAIEKAVLDLIAKTPASS